MGAFDASLVDERLFTFSRLEVCHSDSDKDLMLLVGPSDLLVLDGLQVYTQKEEFPVSLC